MSNTDKLDNILSSLKSNKEPKIIANDEDSPKVKNNLQKVDDIRTILPSSGESDESLGFFAKIASNNMYAGKHLKAREVILDTQVETLKHQASAKLRQSKAYWDAKSVDFAEGLKTYSQENMQLLEQARFDNKSKAVQKAYESAAARMTEIIEGSLPDTMKMELIEKINDARDNTVKRIEKDVLANKYELGPE